jgi:hypothetical protein
VNLDPKLFRTSYCLFQEAWWLDAVAPGGWAEVVIERDGRPIGRMPYVLRRSGSRKLLTQPPFTKFLGPWLAPYSGKKANRPSHEKQVLGDLLAGLPAFDEAKFELHYALDNWQPFFWKGYSQTVYYSYVISDLSNLDAVLQDFRSEKRKDIVKANRQVVVSDDFGPDDLFDHHRMTLAQQGKRISYSRDLLQRMHAAASSRDGGRIWCARDPLGRVHAAIFVVWDERSAFYLISSIDPQHRSSGAATLLVWEAIQYCAAKTEIFDFEGSMIEPVANSFRAFGAVPQPYSIVSRTDSRLLRLRNAVKLALGRP